jgi:ABC-2 type transport system permease protein
MHNLRTVISFEFIRTVRRKSFWLATLAVPALIGVVLAISLFSDKKASESADQAAQQKFNMMVLDESKLIPPAVLGAAGAQIAMSKDQGIQAVKDGAVQVFFYYPPHPGKDQVEVYGRDQGIVKNDEYNQVANRLLEAGATAGIPPEKLALIKDSAVTTLTVYKNGKQVDDSVNRVLVPLLFPVLFVVIMILLANQMLSSTTEEKENRVVELLLTTVSPTALIVGKVIALIAVGCVQILAISIPSAIAYVILHGHVDISKLVFDPAQIVLGALYGACGFLIFTGVLVAIGAAVPTAKEANRFLGFAMVTMLAPMYALAAIITSPDEPIVKVFTYFPLFAPMTLMMRNAMGNLHSSEALLGLAVVAATAAIALLAAVRSFRFGALQYSRKLTLREIFGAQG